MYYLILLYLVLAISPSLIWLSFYLRKDAHPESNSMIIKVFLFGAILTIPAIAVEAIAEKLINYILKDAQLVSISLLLFFSVGFIEEFFKYLSAKIVVFSSSELDEPPDIMLYMIIAALGFAAVENLLYFIPLLVIGIDKTTGLFTMPGIIAVGGIILALQRFIGATFLHTLASGILGYFLAKAYFDPENSVKFIFSGFGLAIGLHTLFNFFIIKAEKTEQLLWLLVDLMMLIGTAIFVTWGFRQLKKLKSICKYHKIT